MKNVAIDHLFNKKKTTKNNPLRNKTKNKTIGHLFFLKKTTTKNSQGCSVEINWFRGAISIYFILF